MRRASTRLPIWASRRATRYSTVRARVPLSAARLRHLSRLMSARQRSPHHSFLEAPTAAPTASPTASPDTALLTSSPTATSTASPTAAPTATPHPPLTDSLRVACPTATPLIKNLVGYTDAQIRAWLATPQNASIQLTGPFDTPHSVQLRHFSDRRRAEARAHPNQRVTRARQTQQLSPHEMKHRDPARIYEIRRTMRARMPSKVRKRREELDSDIFQR